MTTQSLLLRFGDLVIDLERYRVLMDDQLLVLSYREYALLQPIPKTSLAGG